jgi:hypothetical protein
VVDMPSFGGVNSGFGNRYSDITNDFGLTSGEKIAAIEEDASLKRSGFDTDSAMRDIEAQEAIGAIEDEERRGDDPRDSCQQNCSTCTNRCSESTEAIVGILAEGAQESGSVPGKPQSAFNKPNPKFQSNPNSKFNKPNPKFQSNPNSKFNKKT